MNDQDDRGFRVAIENAKRLAKEGRLDDSARVLATHLQSSPLVSEARYLLGTIRMAAGDHRAAMIEIKRGLAAAPDAAQHWHQLGRLYGRGGDHANAARQWWRSHRCAPHDVKILSDLLTIVQRSNDEPPARLLNWHRIIFKLDERDLFRRYVELLTHSRSLRNARAARVLRAALIDDPANKRLYGVLGDENVSPASRDQRQTFRLRLLMLGEPNAQVLSNIALYARASEKYDIAEAYFKRSILFQPTRNIAYFTMFFLTRNRGTLEAARDFLRHAWCVLYRENNGPGTEHLLRRFAELERARGDTRSLIPRFQKALAQATLEADARKSMTRELARCQIEAGDTDGSLRNLQTLERLRTTTPSTYLLADWSSHHYRAGERRAYNRLVDRGFIRSFDLATVDPNLDISGFNAALRRLVTTHPSLAAGSDGGQGDMRQTGDKGPGSLLEDQALELVRLRGYFEHLLSTYRGELPIDPEHPFLKFKDVPAPISLFWGLVIRNCDRVYTHRHAEETFATAIYYAHEAEDIEDPSNPRSGWFEALRPDLNIDMDPADILEIEARPGRFLFLPAYFYHRAMPTRLSTKRVSIVADFNFTPRAEIV